MAIRFASGSSTVSSGTSGCGRVVGTLFFGVFLVMGLGFTVVLTVETLRELATYRWRATPCEILAAEVERSGEHENPYRPAVRYRYEVGGVDYESTRFTRSRQNEASYDAAQRQIAEYRAGSPARCFVDPSEPAQAVLQRQAPWTGLFILLPLIFVAVGAGGIWAMWRRPPPEAQKPLSSRLRSRSSGRAVMIGMGVVFTLVGGGLFVFIGILPAWGLYRAQSWEPTSCEIISSAVRSQSSDDGTTYSVDILYAYHVQGAEYHSSRFDFANFSSSGYRGKKEIVDRYPEGSEATCYVDPQDPGEAVLQRDFRASYLVGLFPLLFLIPGLAVLVAGLKKGQSTAVPELGPGLEAAPADAAGTRQLEAAASPLAKVLGALFLCLFWNGIVSVFVYNLVDEWRHGNQQWFLGVFLIPFVLVGLVMVGAVVYFLLALANPRPLLRLTPGSPRLGQNIRLEWEMRGASQRIGALTITLEGREEASYRRGTTTTTDKEVFLRIQLSSTSNEMLIARGATQALIPEDTMHSFAGSSNKIVWSISVHGDIARWPDVSDSFEIAVRPRAAGELRQ